MHTDSMMSPAWRFFSDMPSIEWPGLLGPDRSILLALLFQLERSQWLPAERVRELQSSQLEIILRHAYTTVPYYRERWGNVCGAPAFNRAVENFSALPLLTRGDLQDHFEALKSRSVPAGHGAVGEARTSGSTGSPVRVVKTQLNNVLWKAFTLRDHRWHQRNLLGKLAAIRHGVPPGEFDGWGEATNGLIATGPSVVRGVGHDVDAHLDWLQKHQPNFLITHPSLAVELAKNSLVRGISFPQLLEVRMFGELLTAETRELCRQAWAAPITDTYSANEVGYMALQCPHHEHYHIQSEGVMVEILDEQGEACGPGMTGRVVVTTLHNFAMPLVRYDIGDYAEVGDACACGRGLPVIRRIIGRVRNMLVTADGKRYWPAFGSRTFTDIAPIVQYQLVQKAVDLIEVRLVTKAQVTADQENTLRKFIQSRIPPGLQVKFTYCERISRSASGKFEDFVCEVPAAVNGASR